VDYFDKLTKYGKQSSSQSVVHATLVETGPTANLSDEEDAPKGSEVGNALLSK